jgi:hypothetical protein
MMSRRVRSGSLVRVFSGLFGGFEGLDFEGLDFEGLDFEGLDFDIFDFGPLAVRCSMLPPP